MPPKLGVQLYTLRTLTETDLRGTLEAVRDLGVRFVEVAGLCGYPASTVRGWLDELGLSCPAGHFGLDLETLDLAGPIAEAKALGCTTVVQPWVPDSLYVGGWAPVAKLYERIASQLKAHGLRFAYHNHSFEFALDGGRPGLDVLFDSSDPSLVLAEIDTYWVQHGGGDPAEYIRKLKGRIPLVHFKDMSRAQPPENIECGAGILDWPNILAACEESGVEHAFIEMDSCQIQPLDSVRQSVEFFRSNGVSD